MAQELPHLILQELIVGKGPLVGSNRPEQRRIADLAHEVDKAIVYALPVEWRKGMALHFNTHRNILGDILLAPERRPQVEIIDELEELEGRSVSYGKIH